MANLINATSKIMRAQTALEGMFGEEGYKLLINKMKEKTHNDPCALVAIYCDENASAEIRLVALATLGE